MPYIKKIDRPALDLWLAQCPPLTSKGILEYCVFKLLKFYMKSREFRYSDLHDATYACIHAGDEFKRRYLDKREDDAIKENGDIE